MKRPIIIALLILLAFSCQKKNPLQVDVSHIPAHVEITRFDTLFYGQSPAQLPTLKKQFPYLFTSGVPDSIWIKKMQDTLFLNLRKEVLKKFPDSLGEEARLRDLFRHIKYYYPKWTEPRIVTLFSDWDYLKRIYLTDTLAFLFIDNYLGKDNPVYEGIPLYIRQTMSKEYIPVDFARRLAERLIPPPRSKDFISEMINQGKIIYLQKAFLPQVPDSLLFGYTSQKWKWATENEKNVWLYFLDNNLLFKSGKNLKMRFIDPAPFSKFYMENDRETAGMIGRYIGYQIVKAYMEKNKTDIRKMITMDEHKLFNQSKYKP